MRIGQLGIQLDRTTCLASGKGTGVLMGYLFIETEDDICSREGCVRGREGGVEADRPLERLQRSADLSAMAILGEVRKALHIRLFGRSRRRRRALQVSGFSRRQRRAHSVRNDARDRGLQRQ